MKEKGLQTQTVVPVAKRGRKKLTIDNSLLFDAFGEVHAAKFSKLKLFYDQDNGNKLKIFTEKIKYPYKLGHQVKEFEIVTNDITKGIEEGDISSFAQRGEPTVARHYYNPDDERTIQGLGPEAKTATELLDKKADAEAAAEKEGDEKQNF